MTEPADREALAELIGQHYVWTDDETSGIYDEDKTYAELADAILARWRLVPVDAPRQWKGVQVVAVPDHPDGFKWRVFGSDGTLRGTYSDPATANQVAERLDALPDEETDQPAWADRKGGLV